MALSSAEAELNASLKGACEGLGLRELSGELGDKFNLELLGDASALTGMLSRRGSGKVKHLEVRQLWLQEKVRGKELEYKKIPRKLNASDALTHHWSYREAKEHFHRVGLRTSRAPRQSPGQ